MPQQDASEIKERIMNSLRRRGPSLPVHVAKEVGMSILFTSAFLSELLSEKKVKISNLRVGSSPVYFIPGQENSLDRFSNFLKSREKDAYTKLRERKFLKDENQEPAIRVALRAIKDFAIPFKRNEEIFWRYIEYPETEFSYVEEKPRIYFEKKETIMPEEKITLTFKTEKHDEMIHEKSKEKITETHEKKQARKEKTKKFLKKKSPQKNEKLFDKVKEFLLNKDIEITGIEDFSKDDLMVRIRKNGEEELLVAYNKKKIEESDITNANKKASELGLKYSLLSLGETPKKLNDLIDSIKNLSEINKIE